jgi:hypothetical protein
MSSVPSDVTFDSEISEKELATITLPDKRSEPILPFVEPDNDARYNTMQEGNENYSEIQLCVDQMTLDDELTTFGKEDSDCLLRWDTYDVDDDLYFNLPLF